MHNIIVGGIKTAVVTRASLATKMVADCLAARAGVRDYPRFVTSSNGSVIARYNLDPIFRAMIDAADIVDADGKPLVIASRLICRDGLPERIATTDLIDDCSAAAADNGLRFFFLGGKPGIASRAADVLTKKYPGLKICGVRDGYSFKWGDISLCEDIIKAKTDVLWVGLGSPLQERFAVDHIKRLKGVGWIRTCGGLFDHVEGSVRRAPNWMQDLGLEWLYRMIQEPARLGPRYLITNPVALYYLIAKTYDIDKLNRNGRL